MQSHSKRAKLQELNWRKVDEWQKAKNKKNGANATTAKGRHLARRHCVTVAGAVSAGES